MISEASRTQIDDLASRNHCLMVTRTLLSIWQQDNPEKLKELDRNNQLIPLIKDLMPALDVAADLKAEAANQWMADHEILQMAELPLHVPTSESLTS